MQKQLERATGLSAGSGGRRSDLDRSLCRWYGWTSNFNASSTFFDPTGATVITPATTGLERDWGRVRRAVRLQLVVSFLPDPARAVAEMARVVRPSGWVATYMWDIPGGGAPTDPIYVSLESMGMTSVRPANPVVSRREAMEDLWEKAGLESIDTRVIRIPVVYSDFDDFWDSNTVLIGPQGKLIARMSTSEREQLRTDLRDRLPTASDGRIVYESFANAVKGRVPG